ncbi:hypothetical protein N8833_01465 [Salibacteraceae bacterium]|nr:hypothetical protein [Salibacteraceae bacterium]
MNDKLLTKYQVMDYLNISRRHFSIENYKEKIVILRNQCKTSQISKEYSSFMVDTKIVKEICLTNSE